MGNTPSKNAHTSISMTPDVVAGPSSSTGGSLQGSEDGGLEDPICSGSSSRNTSDLTSSSWHSGKHLNHHHLSGNGTTVPGPTPTLVPAPARPYGSMPVSMPTPPGTSGFASAAPSLNGMASGAPTALPLLPSPESLSSTDTVPVPGRRNPASFTTPKASLTETGKRPRSANKATAGSPATSLTSTPTPTRSHSLQSFRDTVVSSPSATPTETYNTTTFTSNPNNLLKNATSNGNSATWSSQSQPMDSPVSALPHHRQQHQHSPPFAPSDYYYSPSNSASVAVNAFSSSVSSVGTSLSSSISSYSQSSQSSQSSQPNSPAKSSALDEYAAPASPVYVDAATYRHQQHHTPAFPANTITKANVVAAAYTATTAIGTNVDTATRATTATQQLSTTPLSPRLSSRPRSTLRSASQHQPPPLTAPSQKQQKSRPKQHAVDVNELIDRLLNAGLSSSSSKKLCISNNEIIGICRAARSIFLSQPTLLELGTPVQVVGDIHGQYGDLRRVFQLCGMPPSSNYLFLGDYVDRGKQSIETMLLLLCFKIRYPENVFLLRGNHECASVTRVYGFYDECKRRASVKVWKTFVDTFNTLPIAATIGRKIFCVHGGLSPYLNSLDDIRNIQRPTDIPDVGLLSDLLWSDPDATVDEWKPNDRGVSYCFGKPVVEAFCAKFGFDLIARGHMVVEDGYEFFCRRKLVTVFSAPNYCGDFGNWAAVMSVGKDLLCRFELLKPLDTDGVRLELKNGHTKAKDYSPVAKGKGLAPSLALKG